MTVLKTIFYSAYVLFFFSITQTPTEVYAQAYNTRYVPGEVIVVYKTQKDSLGRLTTNSKDFRNKHNRMAKRRNLRIKKSWDRFGTYQYRIPEGKNVQQVINEIKEDEDIAFVEPNYYVQVSGVPDIPIQPQDIQVQDEGSDALPYEQTSAHIRVPESWSLLTANGNKPIVAVIDTGAEISHPSLADAIWVNPGEIPSNGIDDEGNGYVDDVHGWNFVNSNNNVNDCNNHGTHVSGIVRGATQNIIPNGFGDIPGINDSVLQIMPIKFLNCNGEGTTSDAISAIDYAIKMGAQVLNNSWGGGGYSQSLHNIIATAYSRGIIIVAAAGNSGLDLTSFQNYPASYPVPSLISVGATYSSDYLASFSNFSSTNVPIAAPGVSIYSSIPGGTYGYMSGTSMAAPFVSGIAAMVLHENPNLTGLQVKDILINSSDAPITLEGKIKDKKRVNSLNAVSMAQNALPDGSLPYYDVNAHSPRAPASTVAGCGLVQKVYDDYENNQNGSPQVHSPLSLGILAIILLAPILFALTLRKQTRYKRRFERFFLGSSVQISVGHKEYLGSVGTISLGGLSFNSSAILKLGNPLDLSVQNNSDDHFSVKGEVVWVSNNNQYGVKFVDTDKQTLAKIKEWSKDLKKV